MRLFLALEPPTHVVRDLDEAVRPVRSAHAGLRWIAAERWHLTLVFLGEVPEDRLAPLQRRVARRVAGAPVLRLRFGGAGRFGDRVLWVGVRGDRDELRQLARRLDPGGRPYRPHLTVARSRDHADLRPAVEALQGYEGPAWAAATVHLVRSHLGPQPRYEDVAGWPLRDDRAPEGPPAGMRSGG